MRFTLIALALLALSACGFTPMYGSSGKDGNAKDFLAQVQIDNIPDREGQYLRNALIDRFHSGGATDAAYILTLSPVQESRTELDISISADATRAELELSTTMILRDRKTSGLVLQRSLKSSASYNILASQFTTRVSEDNARLNALDDLARQVEQQVLLYKKR